MYSTIHWINHYPLDNSVGFNSAFESPRQFFYGVWGWCDALTRRTKHAPGVRASRGKWGHAPPEILKIRLSANAFCAF